MEEGRVEGGRVDEGNERGRDGTRHGRREGRRKRAEEGLSEEGREQGREGNFNEEATICNGFSGSTSDPVTSTSSLSLSGRAVT